MSLTLVGPSTILPTLSLQQAEAQLLDEVVRSLTDDIFNKIFSDW